MVTTRPPKTIVKPTALGPVANTDTKLLIYRLFQKGRVLAQDGEREFHRGLLGEEMGNHLCPAFVLPERTLEHCPADARRDVAA